MLIKTRKVKVTCITAIDGDPSSALQAWRYFYTAQSSIFYSVLSLECVHSTACSAGHWYPHWGLGSKQFSCISTM